MFLAWLIKLTHSRVIALSLIAVALACPGVARATTEQLEAQIETYRGAQERELASPSPAHSSTLESLAAAKKYIEKAYGAVLSSLQLQLLAPGNANGPHALEIRDEIDHYALERQIALANAQAIARARDRLYPATPTSATVVAKQNTIPAKPAGATAPDPMSIANSCLEAHTCQPAPTLGNEPTTATATAANAANGLTPSESYTSTSAANVPAPTSVPESPVSTQVLPTSPERAPASESYPAVEVKLTPSDDTTSPGAPIFTGEAQ